MAQPIQPTKSKWLQEVEDDAIRIQTKRFRDQEDERQYKLSKIADEAVKDDKKGK